MNRKLDTDTEVFFYEQDFYVLSNFSAFTLTWKGIRFDTSEAAYHWEKFNYDYEDDGSVPLSNDLAPLREQIRTAISAHEAFKIAERNKQFVRKDWSLVRLGIMRQLLRAKVDQHEYVKVKLLATGDRMLIEDSWRDSFWGWGEDKKGHNALGLLWMSIRDDVKAEKAKFDQLVADTKLRVNRPNS